MPPGAALKTLGFTTRLLEPSGFTTGEGTITPWVPRPLLTLDCCQLHLVGPFAAAAPVVAAASPVASVAFVVFAAACGSCFSQCGHHLPRGQLGRLFTAVVAVPCHDLPLAPAHAARDRRRIAVL